MFRFLNYFMGYPDKLPGNNLKAMLLFPVLLIGLVAHGQEREDLRAAGYEAMQEGNTGVAIRKYHALFHKDSADYDARLALGRLYHRAGDMDSALYFFKMIYHNDSSDVEALHGMAKSNAARGNTGVAIEYAEESVRLMPEYLPSILLLAKVLSYDGQTNKAIQVYQTAIDIDSTLAQAWAGLGKMHYWESRPHAAKKCYRKAASLDPDNAQIKKEYENILNILKVHTSARYQYIHEKEEDYEIQAAVQRYSARKRLTDRTQVSVNFLMDHSRRLYDQPEREDTARWYDNTWITFSRIYENHVISLVAGASLLDNRITAYGLSWKYKARWGKLALENTLNGGYSYYYYWNQVGRHAISEKIKLTRSDFSLSLEFAYGITDEKPVRKYPSDPFMNDENPYYLYGVSLEYKLIAKPDVKVNLNHSYYDFDYYSSHYYTPRDRLLTGASASVLHSFKPFYVYGMFSYNVGSEKYYYLTEGAGGDEEEGMGTIDADNYSGSFEAGYDQGAFSLSLGASWFNNPYYENFVAFLALSLQI